MIVNSKFVSVLKTSMLLLLVCFLLQQCSEEQLMVTPTAQVVAPTTEVTQSALATVPACATCTYVVPANTYNVDGTKLGLKPGAVICLNAATTYKNIYFSNLKGTAASPILITNCGGTVNIAVSGKSFVFLTTNSQYFKISGSGGGYGMKLSGATSQGISLDYLSSNFEIDHLEISNTGYAGIMAKTDPSCDNATIRGNFTMRNVSFHDNYIHDTGAEGLYVGNSFYNKGVSMSCGVRLPHAIEYVQIYNNVMKNNGQEAIQLGCATVGAAVYKNTIENFGTKNKEYHTNGIQIGEGTGGVCYSNYIKSGPGHGISVLGLGDNLVHDNIIVSPGTNGIFCDERYTPITATSGFKFVNNTIINPGNDGIRLYAELVKMNYVLNNIIVNPKSGVYLKLLNSAVKVTQLNNYYTKDINAVKFLAPSSFNYRLATGSPAINKGAVITPYAITEDYYKTSRIKGICVDIGASEF
jgi:hypothetical protein